MKTIYVAGLYYCDSLNLLIRKNKPGHWQHEKYNVLGGHVELQERLEMAMVREFKEECGFQTKTSDWKYCLVLSGPTWVVHFYSMEGSTFDINIPCNEGSVEWHAGIPRTVIPNLNWIIPMLKDKTIIFPIHIQDSK